MRRVVDRLAIREELRVEPDARKAAALLLVATALLLVFYQWGRTGGYVQTGAERVVRDLTAGSGVDLVGSGAYVWWGVSSLVLRVAIPFGIALWLFGLRPRDLGLRFRGTARHLPIYGALFLFMLPLLVLASSLDTFQDTYPFYGLASAGGAAFWIFEFGYALQFVGVEAFFRGFLTFGLARYIGLLAIPIMTVPYTMIHFGKPVPETLGAIIAGLVLGYLALRTKSFVPGVALHIGVALTLDLLVLWRVGALSNLV